MTSPEDRVRRTLDNVRDTFVTYVALYERHILQDKDKAGNYSHFYDNNITMTFNKG